MNKIIFILLTVLFSLSISESFSQSTSQGCQTEPVDSATFFNWPYFGNNQYLLNLVDSLEGSPMSRVIPTTLRIPVTAWVYHINNPADNITNNVVEQYINAVNQFLTNNNSRIRLYLRCNVNHITDNRFFDNISGGNNNTMFDTYYTPRTFNIHFTNNTADGFARGRFPWKNNPYVCFIPTFWSFVGNNFFAPLANTLSHEIGHGLGLLHTHDGSRGNKDNNGKCGNCYQESVSRTMTQGAGCISTIGKKKCEVNADCLCDTDGDPLLLVGGVRYVLPGCAGYDRTSPYQQDKWGSQWLPAGNDNAVRNIMSYSFDNCRIQMTPMQRGVEYFYALYKGTLPFAFQFESFYRNEDVDNFENDNFFQNASNITIGNPQIHSFHLVPDQNSNYAGCDVDWVRFVAPCTNNLQVFTAAIAGKVNANTRLTLFDNTLTQLAQNDNISATNLFSSLLFNFIAGREYFLRIENMNPNSVSYYTLNMGDNLVVNGDNNVCGTSNLFTIPNLPTGVSVTWTANPQNMVIINSPNAVQTTITRNANQNATITLTATLGTQCGVLSPISKSVIIGKGLSNITFNRCIINCDAGPYLYADIVPVPGATNCNWYYKDMSNASNPFVFLEDAMFGTDWPLRRGNRNYTIRAEVITPCGTLIGDRVVFAPSCTGLLVAASPNPTTGDINLTFSEQTDTSSTAKSGGQNLSPARSIQSTGKTIISLFEFNTSLLVRQWTRNDITSKTLNYKVAGLRKGLYILQVDRDNRTATTKIIIE